MRIKKGHIKGKCALVERKGAPIRFYYGDLSKVKGALIQSEMDSGVTSRT